MPDPLRWLRLGLWVVSALIFVVVVAVSLMPQPPAPFFMDDKLSHALAYAVLVQSVLLAGVWAPGLGEGRWPGGGAAVLATAIAIGALIELLQGAYFDRTPDTVDAIANALGATAGAMSWRGLRILMES